MAQMRTFAAQEFEKKYPDKGELMERVLYNHVKDVTRKSGAYGLDFYQFRVCYKSKLYSILQNLARENSSLVELLKNAESEAEGDAVEQNSIAEILTKPSKEWEQELWGLEDSIVADEETELREGTFDCGNCARRGLYSRNTVHRESQTRSSDESMTIFVSCLTCGKNYKF